jgi:diguanylate cyclase (GGDEF)-like protein
MRKPREKIELTLKTKSTVTRRLAWRIAILGVLLSALSFSVVIPWQTRSLKTSAIVEARLLADTVAMLYQSVDRSEEMTKVSELMLRVARMPHVAFIEVVDAQSHVLFGTQPQHIGHVHPHFEGVRESDQLLYVTRSISRPGSQVAAASIVIDLSKIYAEYLRFYIELGVGFAIVIVFLTLIIAWMTRGIVGIRLARLAKAMGNAEKGSFLVRAQVDTMDEVGAVALAFNKLLAAITNMQVKEIEREQDLQAAQVQLSMKTELERVADELHRSNESLKRRVKAQDLLMEAAHHLGGVLNKDALVNRLVSLVRDNLGWPDFAIFLTVTEPEKENHLRLAVASGLPNIDLIRDLSFRFGEGITGLVAQKGEPIVVRNLALDPRVKLWAKLENQDQAPDFLKSGSMLSVPMLYQGRVVGVMDFFYPQANAFDEEDVALLYALGALVATSIVNADLYEATLELATSDSLTGLLNRRAMGRVIENEIARAQRFSTPLSLLLVDVDHFKNYNDRLGHVMGDIALKEIAARLQSTVRKVDSVARFGGEEFCVILPQTNEESAFDVAEKLCAAIRKLETRGGNKQPLGHISVSVGVAVYPDHLPALLRQAPALELIHAADEALYAAKRQGRDRVVCYREGLSTVERSV